MSASKSAKDFLSEAKRYAASGEWDKIDTSIVPAIRKYSSKELVHELYSMFESTNPDVRDLAGTLAAKLRKSELSERDVYRLRYALQRTMCDEHPYASFRATLAAIKLKVYESKDVPVMKKVLTYIIETEEDESLKKLAAKAMEELKKR